MPPPPPSAVEPPAIYSHLGLSAPPPPPPLPLFLFPTQHFPLPLIPKVNTHSRYFDGFLTWVDPVFRNAVDPLCKNSIFSFMLIMIMIFYFFLGIWKGKASKWLLFLPGAIAFGLGTWQILRREEKVCVSFWHWIHDN